MSTATQPPKEPPPAEKEAAPLDYSSQAAPPTAAPIGRQMATSVAWTVFFTVGSRIASFLAQFLLGWLLLPEDYRLVAIVVPLINLGSALVNGGLDRILIQRGNQFRILAWPAFVTATGCNIVLGGGICLLAPFYAYAYGSATVGWLMVFIGSSTAYASLPNFAIAKLQIDLRFGVYSTLMLSSSIATHLLSVAMALLGFGAYSIIVPLSIMHAANIFLFGYFAGPLPRNGRWTWRRSVCLMHSARWVLVVGFASVLSYSGDYMVIGWFGKSWLGQYFFGFKLSTAFTAIVAIGVSKVTLAGFAKIAKEPERFRNAVLRASGLLTAATPPVAITLALLVPAAVHIAWQGKWDEAIYVAALMTAIIPIDLVNVFCRTTLSARGDWRGNAVLSIVHGLGLMAAAALGCWIGGLWVTIQWVALYQLAAGVIMTSYVLHRTGVGWDAARERLVIPAIFSFLPLVAVMILVTALDWNLADWWAGALAATLYIALFIPLARIGMPGAFDGLASKFGKLLAKVRR